MYKQTRRTPESKKNRRWRTDLKNRGRTNLKKNQRSDDEEPTIWRWRTEERSDDEEQHQRTEEGQIWVGNWTIWVWSTRRTQKIVRKKKSELPTCFNFVSMFFIVIIPTSYCLLPTELWSDVEAVMEAGVAAVMEARVGGCHCLCSWRYTERRRRRLIWKKKKKKKKGWNSSL